MNWRKSARSGANGENCVELARFPSVIGARDSKDPNGPFHAFSVVTVAALFEEIRHGRYDLT
ncbi:uncharacterized protein DUF397 [Actinomadura pelletieri DSM 43383]|uniref:Uncharacterized protein DUF397 n=1 Tax=Actinomadura pelletieri DSM 43383 TaxID=1120940 RepID=A0A495QHG5_9ACTN|nr:DUF397 domain-containing protein [Actinomadura pelletieri]RKS71181.1 uncharacterized protein DUF397 [Actinomadura pelletieri DSM 43383]